MKEIFFNSSERLRSGWRIASFATLFFIFYFITGIILFLTAQSATGDALKFLGSSQGLFVSALVNLLVVTILGWICGKVFEDLPFKALGWVFNRTWIKDFLLGLLLGAVALTIAVGLAMPTGGVGLMFNQTDSSEKILLTFAYSFIVFFAAAALEEVLFRGYVLQTLFRADLIWFGILVTSIFFGLVHNNNPSASFFSLFNTFLAGIWFGVAYLKTRSLWLAFGLHLAWNWMQGAFYGINVSGISDIAPNPLLRTIDQGPTWLTGGHYGIEGGVTCTIALIVSTVLIWFLPVLKPTEEMLALTNHENPKEFA